MVRSQESQEPQPRAKCPYCGCGFIPTEPGQVYCSVFCEQQHQLEKGRS